MYIAAPPDAASSAFDPAITTAVSSLAHALPVRASWLADCLRIAFRWFWKWFLHSMSDISEYVSVLRWTQFTNTMASRNFDLSSHHRHSFIPYELEAFTRCVALSRPREAPSDFSTDYLLNKIVSFLLDWPTTSFDLVTYIGVLSDCPHNN